MRCISNLVLCSSLLLMSGVSFAEKLSQEEIDLVNKQILKTPHAQFWKAWGFDLGFLNATEDEKGVISGFEFKIEIKEPVAKSSVILGFNFAEDLIELTGEGESVFHSKMKSLFKDDLPMRLKDLPEVLTALRKQGYRLAVNSYFDVESFYSTMTLDPWVRDTNLSYAIREGILSVQNSFAQNRSNAYASAILVSKTDLVQRSRDSFTKIFNILRRGEMPTKEDMQAAEKIIAEIQYVLHEVLVPESGNSGPKLENAETEDEIAQDVLDRNSEDTRSDLSDEL